MNSNYGKLIDGVLTFAPINLVIDDMQVINASEDEYMSAGYLPIEYTPKPDDNHWQAVYTEVDGRILQSWVYEGKIHDHSNLSILEDVTIDSLSGVPAVHTLPIDAKDGDMCLYAPMNTLTLEDSGKRIYFDWEEFAKPLDVEDRWCGINASNSNDGYNTHCMINATRSFSECSIGVEISRGGSHYENLGVSFVDGEIFSEASFYLKFTSNGDEEYYNINSVDELPLYMNLPEFDTFGDQDINASDNNFMFCTDYRLMKYQGGEWVELTDNINNAIESLKSQVTSIPKFSISVVDVLPTEDISETTIYLVKDNETESNLYTEYVYINGVWEKLGTQTLNLEGYAKIEDIPSTEDLVAAVIAALPIAEGVDF